MADETGSGPGDIRVNNIHANRQFSQEVHVERFSVNTNESQNAESDLLNDLTSVVTRQTATLESILNEIDNKAQMQLQALRTIAREGTTSGGGGAIHDEMRQSIERLRQAIVALNANEAVPDGGGEGGGGGGGSHGRGVGEAVVAGELLAEARNMVRETLGMNQYNPNLIGPQILTAYQRNINTVGTLSDRFTSLGGQFKLFGTGVLRQVESNMINLADSVQRFGARLTDTSNITQSFMRRVNDGIEIATTGVADFNDVVLDFIPGFIRAGDNLVDTFAQVRNSLESDLISPLGTMGSDLDEVSQSLMNAREGMRDGMNLSALDRLKWSEANDTIISLFALERRRDATAQIDRPSTERRIASQLQFAQLIATNTGRTALEVVKLNEQNARNLRNLEAGGVLQGDERQNFEKAIAAFAQTPGMGPFAEMLAGIARSGGSVELFLAQNPDLATDLAAMNQIPQLRSLLATVRGAGGMSDKERLNALMQAATGFNTSRFTGIAGASVISDRGLELAGAAGMARTFRGDEDVDIFQRNLRYLGDVFSNYLPKAELAMVAALVANTVALGVNTAALGGGGLIKGALGLLGRGARFIGSVAGGAAGLAGAGIRGAGSLGMGALGALGLGGAAMTGHVDTPDMRLGRHVRGTGGIAKGIGKSLLRKIPFGIGLLASLPFIASSAMAGDFTGAGLELASGVAGTIPGIGTAASLGIDAALTARDMGVFDSGDVKTASPQATSTVATSNAGLRTETQRMLIAQTGVLKDILDELREQTTLEEDIERNTKMVKVQTDSGFWDHIFGGDAAPASPPRG